MTKEKLRDKLKENTFNIKKALNLCIEQNNRLSKPIDTEFDFLRYIDESRLIVTGGASGIGKTALILQMLYEIALKNDDTICIYANAEMTIEELTKRLVVNQVDDISVINFRNEISNKNPNIQANIAKIELLIDIGNFYFLNAQEFTLENIIDLIELVREKNKDKRIFIVIDYLQLLLLDKANLNDINAVLKKLKDCLVKTKANCIAISALNREAIRGNIIDTTAFRDSSAIEYTSDIACLMCLKRVSAKGKIYYELKLREEEYEMDNIKIHFKAVKNRIGKMFNYPLNFDKLNQKFSFVDEKTNTDNERKKTNDNEEEFLTVYDVI